MIPDVVAPADADVALVKAYAAHVAGCWVCKQANLEDELCNEGGALWDAVADDDPTDPGTICARCCCAAPFHRMGCKNA